MFIYRSVYNFELKRSGSILDKGFRKKKHRVPFFIFNTIAIKRNIFLLKVQGSNLHHLKSESYIIFNVKLY